MLFSEIQLSPEMYIVRASGTGIKNKYLFILTQGNAEIQGNFWVNSTSMEVACIS
jgi:hypothetical protein